MTDLAIVFLITLLVAIGFYAYFYIYLREHLKGKPTPQTETETPRLQNVAKDLREMFQMLDRHNLDNAKLVAEQLRYRKFNSKEYPDVLAIRVCAHYQLKDYPSALKCALELSHQPQKGRFMTENQLIEYLASIYSSLGQHEKAYQEYILLVQRFPRNIEYLYEAASQALEMRQHNTATALFERASSLEPHHLPTIAKLGRIYCEKRLYTQALDFFGRAYTQNYDSDEMRYYMAIALIHTSGQDQVALSLLQRVAESPKWAKQALPRVSYLAMKLKNYSQVVATVNRFRDTFGEESSEGLLSELTMQQAQAHRQLHEFPKACLLLKSISPENAHYREAQNNLAFFQLFTEPGVYRDYTESPLPNFLDLCFDISTFIAAQSFAKRRLPLEKKVLSEITIIDPEELKLELGDEIETKKPAEGALIIESLQDRWDSNSKRLLHIAPNLYIFLRLDQELTGRHLEAALHHLGIDKNYDKAANIHVYALHRIPQTNFENTSLYNLFLHKSEEFQTLLDQFQEYQEEQEEQESQNSPTPLTE